MTAVRLALGVCLAVALLGVSLPAVDATRADRAALGAERALATLDAEAAALASDAAAAPGDAPAARRTVVVSVPGDAWFEGRAELRLGCPDCPPGDARYVVGGETTTRRLDAPVRPAAERLRLGPGDHRLRLSYVRAEGEAVVRVRVANGSREGDPARAGTAEGS